MKNIATIGLVILLGRSAFAANGERKQNRLDRIEQKQERFETFKNIEMDSHQVRIDILKTADNCLANATTREEYKICEKVEGDSRKVNQTNVKNARSELRTTRHTRRNK